MKKRASVKQDDVAKRARVGKSTVSMILNGHGKRFSDEVVARVLTADRELGYSAGKFTGRQQVEPPASTPADVIYCIKTSHSATALPPLYAELAFALERSLRRTDQELIIKTVREADELTQTLSRRQAGVAGVICHGAFNDDELAAIPDEIPGVLLLPHSPCSRYPVLELDNQEGAFRLVEHLADLGHSRFVFHGYAPESKHSFDRLNGFLLALRKRGLTESIPFEKIAAAAAGKTQDESAAMLLDLIQETSPTPTAVVCATSQVASSFVLKSLERNLKIPEDLSVTGFNNLLIGAPAPLDLTCLNIPVERLAEQAVKIMTAARRGLIIDDLAMRIGCGLIIPGQTSANPVRR
jgi:LacI family transcriptional regulator